MKKHFSKIGFMSIAVSFLLSGCAIKNVENTESIKLKQLVKNYRASQNSVTKDIEVIKIPSYTNKYVNLRHDFPEKSKIISLKISSGYFGKINNLFGIPVKVDTLLTGNKIEGFYFQGKFENLLDRLASLNDCYWTYDNGVIKFQKYAQVIYTFPALSLEKISEVYNLGEIDSDRTVNINIKNSIFEDIKVVVQSLINSNTISGQIIYNTSDQLAQKIDFLKQKDKNNKFDNQKSNKNTKNIIKVKNTDNESKDMNTFSSNKSLSLPNGMKTLLKNSVSSFKSKRKKSSSVDSVKTNIANNSGLMKTENSKKSFTNKNDFLYSKNSQKAYFDKTSKKENKTNDILEKKSISYTENIKTDQNRIVLSPNSGTVIAYITPKEEKILDIVLSKIIQKRFSNMVRLKTIALLTTEERIKEFTNDFNALLKNTTAKSATQLGLSATGGFSFLLTKDPTQVTAANSVNAIVDYFTSGNSGTVLLNPSIVSLPNVITRIQDSSNIPYIEPEQLTNTQDGTLSYQVKYIQEGINMSAIFNVFNDNIIMAIKFSVTQYLGDKTIKAGSLGDFTLPMIAPKIIQTTYRVSPGDIIVLAGLKQNKHSFTKNTHFEIPTDLKNSNSNLEFVFISMPTLIKFQAEKNVKKEYLKDIDFKKIDMVRIPKILYEPKIKAKKEKVDIGIKINDSNDKNLKILKEYLKK